MKERREFMDLVEKETRPIKRAAYLKQAKINAIEEGRRKAKQDAEMMQQKKTLGDFGIQEGLNNPMKFLNKKEDKDEK